MKHTSVRIPANLAEKLRKEAKANFRSLTAHVVAILANSKEGAK